jgi:hypothetical protein
MDSGWVQFRAGWVMMFTSGSIMSRLHTHGQTFPLVELNRNTEIPSPKKIVSLKKWDCVALKFYDLCCDSPHTPATPWPVLHPGSIARTSLALVLTWASCLSDTLWVDWDQTPKEAHAFLELQNCPTMLWDFPYYTSVQLNISSLCMENFNMLHESGLLKLVSRQYEPEGCYISFPHSEPLCFHQLSLIAAVSMRSTSCIITLMDVRYP